MKKITKAVFGSGRPSLEAMGLTLIRLNVSLRRKQLSLTKYERGLQ